MELETVVDDSGPAIQEPCPVCGTTDFFVEGGFYYCSLCNTQSQVSRIYVDEIFQPDAENRPAQRRAAALRGEKRKKKRTVQEVGRQLSTWEIWNVILKNMTDRLIEIGFPEDIRPKILHIYTTFMIKRKVIFVSTSNSTSTITYREPKTNLYALYGVPRPSNKKYTKRRKMLTKKIRAQNDSVVDNEGEAPSRRMAAITKRKAMEKEYLSKQNVVSEIADDAGEFENIISEESRRKSQLSSASSSHERSRNFRLTCTKAAKKALRTQGKGYGYAKRRLLRAYEKRGKHAKLSRLGPEYNTKFERFTLSTCLIVLFVALRELGFPIVMTDIMRLYLVGILRFDDIRQLINKLPQYKEIKQFFPVFYFYTSLPNTIHSYGEDIERFVNYIRIEKFRFPQMKEVVPKYIDEFVLPREFECLVNLNNHLFTFNDYVDDLNPKVHLENYRALPEVLVLAEFVIVLKMLFGMDDTTEKYQSEFAKLVNKLLKEEVDKRDWEMEEWAELFVIEDWFRYLQRRREVVRRELCCPSMYTPNKPPTIAKIDELMRSCTLEDDPNDDASTPEEKAAKSCKNLFERILKETLAKSEENPEIPKLKPYVPLPLPTESIVRQYVERYPLVGDKAVKPELLSVDFVKKRLDFIWNPKKYKRLLKLNGYKVKVVHGDAINNFPDDYTEEDADPKVVLLFQPYKNFDEYVGRVRDDCSSSMKLILGLCEDIIPGVSPDKLELKYTEPFVQKLVNAVGDMYIKRVLAELVPIMTRWDEMDSD